MKFFHFTHPREPSQYNSSEVYDESINLDLVWKVDWASHGTDKDMVGVYSTDEKYTIVYGKENIARLRKVLRSRTKDEG